MASIFLLRLALALFYAGSAWKAYQGELSAFGLQGPMLAALFGIMAVLFLTRVYFVPAILSAVYFGITIWAVHDLTIITEACMMLVSISTALPEGGELSPREIVESYRDLISGKKKK